MSKYTKGEWEVDKHTYPYACDFIIKSGEKSIVQVGNINYQIPLQESKANAKLIAAAPDLFRELENLIEKCLRTADTTLMHEELYNAQQAIKKATK